MSEATNPYSRLLGWEVWNFMSIEHAKVEFDERNIINFKGYNDSGKSAMLQALKVLMSNSDQTKQVLFIKDDKEYFRIVAYFDDGIMIMRDKYINGQSLYEMYKGKECIFSTKQANGALTGVNKVPDPIQEYLGLILYDNTCLNARACFEKQIGVQTTGSENYKMFNTILKSEEIARAAELLNTDKNKLVSDINGVDNEIRVKKSMIEKSQSLTRDIIDFLKESDSELTSAESMQVSLDNINTISSAISKLKILPELDTINTSELTDLLRLQEIMSAIKNINITPQLEQIDNSRLDTLIKIVSLKNNVESCKVSPEVPCVDSDILSVLIQLKNTRDKIDECENIIKETDTKLKSLDSELSDLQSQLSSMNVNMIKCPCCGSLFSPDEVHTH